MTIQPLITAFQLLTRIPIPIAVEATPQNRGYSILFYPLVGVVIGGALALLAYFLPTLPLPLQASLVLVLWVALTGGLHLDGLADSADAWVGGMGDRERMLEIMKDPTSGPMGVISIVLLLLVKWSAIMALLKGGEWMMLIWPPILARTALITLFQTTPYIRPGGMGDGISSNIPRLLGMLVQIAVLGAALFYGVSWIMLFTAAITLLLFRWITIKQLGGITGDIAGAMVEKMEALLLLLLVFR